jgi:DNA-binding transcriptional MerR regulator
MVELKEVHTGAVASALDTVIGAPKRASSGRTSGAWVRSCIDRGLTYGNRDDDRGWYAFHLEELFHLGVARRLRDLGVPFGTIETVVEELEFGPKTKVRITHGSVAIVVDQRIALQEARRMLIIANNREHGTEFTLPKVLAQQSAMLH